MFKTVGGLQVSLEYNTEYCGKKKKLQESVSYMWAFCQPLIDTIIKIIIPTHILTVVCFFSFTNSIVFVLASSILDTFYSFLLL